VLHTLVFSLLINNVIFYAILGNDFFRRGSRFVNWLFGDVGD
jgi:hypothetical protein